MYFWYLPKTNPFGWIFDIITLKSISKYFAWKIPGVHHIRNGGYPDMNKKTTKLALAGVFTAVAVIGSLISIPVAGSKCAPVQHMVNIFSAVLLGPWWGIAIAFVASLLRNLFGLGSFLAFPGSMIGAFCCGIVYYFCQKISLTCIAEALGTGFLGGLAAVPVAKWLMQIPVGGAFVYVIPFFISTFAGSILSFVIFSVLKKSGSLIQLQEMVHNKRK